MTYLTTTITKMAATFRKSLFALNLVICTHISRWLGKKCSRADYYFFAGFIISGADSPKQIPRDPSSPRPMIWNGLHGYDAKHPDMRTIFMAKGPAFKKHYQGEPIHLVDIYQIYAHILGIEPQPHNGSWTRVNSYLINSASSTQFLKVTPILSTLLIVLSYLI